jgi:hypothetical protein
MSFATEERRFKEFMNKKPTNAQIMARIKRITAGKTPKSAKKFEVMKWGLQNSPKNFHFQLSEAMFTIQEESNTGFWNMRENRMVKEFSIPQNLVNRELSKFTPRKKNTTAPKKVAPKKVAPKKVAPKKVAPICPPKKAAPKKAAPKKVAPKKATPKKVAPKKAAPKKVAPKKVAPKKAAPKKVAPKKAVPKKAVPKRVAPKKVVPKKVAPKKATPSKSCVLARQFAKDICKQQC